MGHCGHRIKHTADPDLYVDGHSLRQGQSRQTDSSGMEPGRVGTYILHALDVGFNLLQHTGMPLRLLSTPHSLVDAFSHLLDVPLCIQ